MACILRNTKAERILYSADYPFAKNERVAVNGGVGEKWDDE